MSQQARKALPGTMEDAIPDGSPISEYLAGWDSRSHEEALDEVGRECLVRLRVFARWVAEGRMSKSDAKDRLQRLILAYEIIRKALTAEEVEA